MSIQDGPAKTDLERLAVLVAASVAEKFNVHGTRAYVPRSAVLEIRRECERRGIDWRKLRAQIQATEEGSTCSTG